MAAADAQADARVLARLSAVVESRRGGGPDVSYTARLFAGGTAGIARKLGGSPATLPAPNSVAGAFVALAEPLCA